MPSLMLTLETVTPLLMNGGDYYLDSQQREQPIPEIRAASFRGVLRYWLRAVLGGIYQGDIAALKAEESRYFGSTEAGSPLRVRVEHSLNAWNKDARDYFRHPVLPPRFEFTGYQTKQRFSLIFDTHPLQHEESVFTPAFYAALLLAFHLGAFGKRSRRGGGALRIIEASGDCLPHDVKTLLEYVPANGKELQNFIQSKLLPYVEWAQQHSSYQPQHVYSQHSLPSYPIFKPEQVKILIGESSQDYLTALRSFWGPTGDYHRLPQRDKNGQILTNNQGQPRLKKWAWGYAIGTDRRASALHIRVHLLQNDFCPVVTIFHSSGVDDRGQTKREDWSSIQEVITSLVPEVFTSINWNNSDRIVWS